MKKKIKFMIIAGVLIIAVLAAGVFILKERGANGKIIKASGIIEGDDVRISFRVQGQIEELLSDEGMVIKKGDIVARLNKDELSKVKAEAEAALKLAEYQYKLDYDDYIRAENLLKAGAISAQKRDAARTQMDTDSANIKQLRASLELANTKLGWADLASPLDGYVLVKSALAGEVVQPGAPVFTAVNLDNIWVTAYINEYDLGKVKLGQKAYVETDTYRGKKYSGRVSFISSQAEFTPKYIQTNEERVKYVYRIKVRADNSSLDLKPGMPADAYIILE
ncbi:MAG: efflux RND transporter periplasmic adaptor subunit [Candidatus Omnitrophica bacterium]|nr:efflux RND transporter periplasmic adaptor subunit [Candidatus Omnitrophota bacterium]MDD5592761.1 efflux RND transporter periplasmic adaptor subunit [Candidatus Omnitrophota bacterium]